LAGLITVTEFDHHREAVTFVAQELDVTDLVIWNSAGGSKET
jgi:hypothetical protein